MYVGERIWRGWDCVDEVASWLWEEEEEVRRRLECDGERWLSGIGHVLDIVGMMTTCAFSFVKSVGELSRKITRHVLTIEIK